MPAQDFMAALEAPDDYASHKQLQLLASERPIWSAELSNTAVAFLHAFCSDAHSNIKRRWIGLALRNLLGASPVITKSLLDHADSGFPKIGDIISSASESEDIKLVAGLIVREALAQKITLGSFWKDEHILNLPSAFPKNTSLMWMKEFHGFVEVVQRCLEKEMTPLHIYHPLSLTIPKKDDWSDETRPIVFMDAAAFTLVRLGIDSRPIEFVDVQVEHIASISEQPSTRPDDISSRKPSEPWDVTLEFKPSDCTYRINSSEQSETSLVITFTAMSEAHKFVMDLENSTGLSANRITSSPKTMLEDEFGFPEQSTRIIRPPNPKNKKGSNDSGCKKKALSKEQDSARKGKSKCSNPVLDSVQRQQPQRALVDKPSASPVDNHDSLEVVAHSSTMHAETDILEKLNSQNNDNDNITFPSPSPERNMVLGKRPLVDQVPSTPPSKRLRREHALSTCEASVMVPPTTRRSRVLEDPPSPCGQRKRPSPNLTQESSHNMQSPFNPESNETSQLANFSVSNIELDKRQTPVQHTKRTHSGESNIELLSSNSKPTPASPHAESTAISGHADPRRVNMEKQIADDEIRRTNPFSETAFRKIKATSFSRKLSREMSASQTPNKNPRHLSNDRSIDLGGDTLIEPDEDALPTIAKETPAHPRSSPTPLTHSSPSTHSTPSSTSSSNPKTSSTPASASSSAEAAQWEASLQPHQRTLHDRLLRVSNRVTRFIADNETVVDDIVESYRDDGEAVLCALVERHADGIDALEQDLEAKTDVVKRSCAGLLERLRRERERVVGLDLGLSG